MVSCRKIIETALVDAGADLKATVKAPEWSNGRWTEVDKPRFVWVTHGNETSQSKYSYCQNEVWIGVLHLSFTTIGSQIAGQMDDLLANIPTLTLHDVCESEICYCFHQGFARSSCRITHKGIAQPAKIWITYKGRYRIKEILQGELDGMKWEIYRAMSKKTHPDVGGNTEDMVALNNAKDKLLNAI